ncbi:MAG TPA: shikimate kinase [Chitinophagaceae bacterium]|nr:shikimate kinase [Chitinophagaceae bacterium]
MKIYLLGFMGCGKTHWARLISEKLGIPYFDLDDAIVQSEKRTINELFTEEGEEYFRRKEKEILTSITETKGSFVMACGGGTPCFFNNIDYMNRNGTTIWINCSIDCLHARLVKEKDKRPLIRTLSDEELRSYIIKKYADRKIFYQQASVILNEDHITLEKMLEPIFHDKG